MLDRPSKPAGPASQQVAQASGAAAKGPAQEDAPRGSGWAGAAGPAGRPSRQAHAPRAPLFSLSFFFYLPFLFVSLLVCLDGLQN
jgi:hypothetical protein